MMNDKAIARFNRRTQVFMQEGLCKDGAFDLATSMYRRDEDPYDDRRVCFECEHYVAKRCMKMRDKFGKPQMPLRFILQRCDDFDLKGKK